MNEGPVTRSGGLGPPLAPSGGMRPSVIQLVFREKGALYAAYMPLLTDGGLFVPTTREYRLGEDIYLVKLKIEELLGTTLQSAKPTQTL